MTVKVIVGISGGVDSAVAALILKERGYLVEGLFMQNWEEDNNFNECRVNEDLIDARRVAIRLGIRLHYANFAREYWDRVFSYFLREYQAGRTPNPDILCNSEIKFPEFLKFAKENNADFIATGHYARVKRNQDRFYLCEGVDEKKDQSYFLARLKENHLKKTLFPLGNLCKKEVKERATKFFLPNVNRRESMGICFIGKCNFPLFLQKYITPKPGKIISIDGKIVGNHKGVHFYTIGQRTGLGIGGVKNLKESAFYVARKDILHNSLIVVQGRDHPALNRTQLTASNFQMIDGNLPTLPLNCQAKIRYREKKESCTISHYKPKQILVTFAKPLFAITPGQFIVFYRGKICLGSAIIDEDEK